MTFDLGTHPSPVRPGGPPPPPVPLPPPPPPRPAPPPKATGPTGPDPIGDPPPDPGPSRPNHLVDFGFRMEVRSGACELLAEASVRDSGLWWLTWLGRPPVYVGGREQATSEMRSLVVSL